MESLSAAIAKFSTRFCDELDKDKSVVCSPLSAEFVLALLTLGSTDPAHSELLTALGLLDDDSIRSLFSKLSSKLKALKGVTFNVANKIYVKDGPCELQPTLEADAVQVFDAAIEKLDFSKGAAAAALINQWVDSKTNHKIRDLMSPDSVNNFTRLILINALYFKGSWVKQFYPKLTNDKEFHVNVNLSVNVPMMYTEDNFTYGVSDTLQAQLLKMPYQGEEASMLLVLPREVEGLQGVLSKLASGYDLISDMKNMHITKVQVSIPKFKIESRINLNLLLPKLGIRAIFDQHNSGLTKVLNPGEHLYVSEALQKAMIEVNEEGAEAAATTRLRIVLKSKTPRSAPPRFNADRPFLFMLYGDDYTPLFIGIYRGGDHSSSK